MYRSYLMKAVVPEFLKYLHSKSLNKKFCAQQINKYVFNLLLLTTIEKLLLLRFNDISLYKIC